MAERMKGPEGRRKKILQTAGELIEEIGISAITHQKVTERARMPFRSTTQYFKSLVDILAEAFTRLEEEHEEKLAELNEVNGPIGLVANMVVESLADLKRTRNEISFTLLYTTHSKFRHFIVPGNVALVERLSRNIPEATGRAVLAYCYRVLFQAVAQDAATPHEEIEGALYRLIGDSAEWRDS